MVQLIEKLIKEHQTFKNIDICCGYCEQILVDFVYAKSTKKYWEIDSNDIDWDVKFKIKSKYIICECAEIVGIVYHNHIYHLNKKAVKIIY